MICSTIFFKKKLANKTCLDDVYQPQSQYNVGHLTVKLHGASKGLHYIIWNIIIIIDIALSTILFTTFVFFSVPTGPNVTLL